MINWLYWFFFGKIPITIKMIEMVNGSSDRSAIRRVRWRAKPVVGEMINLGGNYHEVDSVWHDIDGWPKEIEVHLECDTQDYEALIEDYRHWRIRTT